MSEQRPSSAPFTLDSVDEGQKVVNKVSQLLACTGFKLAKWNASDEAILIDISRKDRAPAQLMWNTDTDELTIKMPTFIIEKKEELTKKTLYVTSIKSLTHYDGEHHVALE